MTSLGRLGGIVAAALVLAGPACSVAPTHEGAEAMVVLVRHAEKAVEEGDDPSLTQRGRERARRLAALLSPLTLDAVYASEYRRTQETARLVAAGRGPELEVVPAREPARLAALIAANDAGGAALVVGHSNTLPEIMLELGVIDPPAIGDDEYDDVFILFVRPGDEARFVHLVLENGADVGPPVAERVPA